MDDLNVLLGKSCSITFVDFLVCFLDEKSMRDILTIKCPEERSIYLDKRKMVWGRVLVVLL